MLREKWREKLPQDSAGDIASRLLEQLSDEDIARLGFEALIGRAQWAQAQIAQGQKVECLNPEVERDGWGCPHSLLALCLPDQPFLIDTLRLEIRRHGRAIHFKTYQSGVDELIEVIPTVVRGAPEQHFRAFQDQWTEQGVPPALASFLAATPSLAAAPAVIEAAQETQMETRWVADVFMALGECLGLQQFARAVNTLSVSNAWEARARDGLRDDLDRAYLHLVKAVVNIDGDTADQRIKVWMSNKPETIKQWNEILTAAVGGGDQSYPLMAVAGRSLAQLANNT